MATQVALKALVQGAYDVQKLRIAIGNRVCQCFYQSRGVKPGTKPKEELDRENQRLLKNIKAEYHGLAAGITKLKAEGRFKVKPKDTIIGPGDFEPTNYLPEYVMLNLCRMHDGLEAQEDAAFRDVERNLAGVPIWEKHLKSVTGCGPAMAGVLVALIDIRKAPYVSSLWAFAGLDVAADGKGRSRRKEHLIKRTYTNRDGQEDTRDSITFDPLLKTKLVGVLGGCLMRSGNAYYKGIYDNYKNRLEHRPDWKGTTPGHRHRAAVRYMVKLFLADLWVAWRQLEGLPVTQTYAEAKLGIVHGGAYVVEAAE
jgi:hypothetical protein